MKLDQLTFTRFLAAIAIIVYHFGMKVFPFNRPYLHEFFANSDIFVSYFFILSGFVMVIANSRKQGQQIDYPSYYVNRFARIYPLYILALVIMILPHIKRFDVLSFMLQSTLLQSWVPSYAFRGNPAAWSLSTEAFFYLMFPLLFNNFYSKYKKRYIYLGILFYVVLCYVGTKLLFTIPYVRTNAVIKHDIGALPLLRIAEFLIGNALGLYFITIPTRYFRNYDLPVIAVFLLIVLSLIFKKQLMVPHPNYLYWSLFSVFIVLLSLNSTGYVTRLFNKKPLVLAGEISYGVYILQFPVWTILYFIQFFAGKNAVLSNFFFSAGVLVLASYLTYRFIEIPGREYIRSYYAARKARRQNTVAGV